MRAEWLSSPAKGPMSTKETHSSPPSTCCCCGLLDYETPLGNGTCLPAEEPEMLRLGFDPRSSLFAF